MKTFMPSDLLTKDSQGENINNNTCLLQNRETHSPMMSQTMVESTSDVSRQLAPLSATLLLPDL